MLLKLNPKDDSQPGGIGVWSTGLSWLNNEGTIHPITAKVVYAFPHFEVVDVSLDYDKQLVEIPSRMESMVVAAAIEVYSQSLDTIKKDYENRKKATTKSHLIDPLFE